MSGSVNAGWIAALLTGSLLFADADPKQNSGADVIARDARLKFVERRTLAVERPGILSEAVREGERVEAGMIVLRVRDAVPKSALAVAAARADSNADVRAAQKEHEAAAFEYQTHVKANQSRPGTYSEIDVRRVQLAAESAALKVELAEHERAVNQRLKEQAHDELSTYYVPSTISGLVTRAFKGAGEAVQLGEPVLEIVNTDTVRVEGYVPLQDVWQIKVGAAVTVRVELRVAGEADRAGKQASVVTVDGVLGFIDVDVQPVAKVVRVWADIPNPQGLLRDGLDAELVIHVADRPTVSGTSSR
jgi:hypothetical protein